MRISRYPTRKIISQKSFMPSGAVDCTVRPASEDQVEELVLLMRELGYETTRETMQSQLRRYANSDTSEILVAEIDSELCGVISGHLIPALHQPGNIGRITAMVVAERARSSGVGSRLLSSLERWFRANDCLRYEVTSGDHRPTAHRFYESHGYESDERRFLKIP